MENEVLETDSFSKLFETLEWDEKEWVKKIILQLKANANVGKPLGFKWFREKQFKGKRLYYLVYNNLNKVLLVGFGGKKEQQKIINHILANRGRYRKFVENIQ